MNGSIKDILNLVVKTLESVTTDLGALEALLIEQQTISSVDLGRYRAVHLQSVKHTLANARYWIGSLPD